MTANAKRGPADPETPPEQPSPSKEERGKAIPKARAVGLEPSPGRKLWAWVVGKCPFCGFPHIHRGGSRGGERAAGCRRGRYWVGAK